MADAGELISGRRIRRSPGVWCGESEFCAQAHVGLVVSGTVVFVTEDDERILVHQGEAYLVATPHVARVLGDELMVAIEFPPEVAIEFASEEFEESGAVIHLDPGAGHDPMGYFLAGGQ